MKKTLGRSITRGCLVFIALLCVCLGIVSHLSYRRALYHRYEAYIADLLHYVDSHIDDEDLSACVKTLERSSKFDELEVFMDGIKQDFTIHYLYILQPRVIEGHSCIMSIISAENYYDRYIDTEENLYLGWISDDEYDEETVKQLFRIMERKEICFFEEKTEWGTDYTGALALYDAERQPYAILAVDVDISYIKMIIRQRTVGVSLLIILCGAIFTVLFLLWARKDITQPIKLLEKSVVAFAQKSHGQRDSEALRFEPPHIHAQNEIAVLADAVTKMTEDMRDYVTSIFLAERKADDMQKQAFQMNELATKDSLTGIRNKTAYDREIKRMEWELVNGNRPAFGIAMVDLNFLKRINDTYGHEQGNNAIKNLSSLICTTFAHSPVFRIGGDEFVVILEGSDYEHIASLMKAFHEKLEQLAADDALELWEKVSAAIGVAFYDREIDADVANVFKRADQEMYLCKKQMKAIRES